MAKKKQADLTPENKTIYGDISNRLFAVGLDLAILYLPLVTLTSLGLSMFFDVSNQLALTQAKVYSTNPELARNAEGTINFIVKNYPADMVIIIRQWIFSLSVNFALIGIYTIPMTVRYGATLGKLMLGLKVVDIITGGKLTISQATIRYLSYLVSIPLGLIFAGFRRDRRAWHDFLGDSVVIYSPDRWYKKHVDKITARIKKFFNIKH